MKGKESLIGTIIGIIISVAAGMLALNSDDIKQSVCGQNQSQVQAK